MTVGNVTITPEELDQLAEKVSELLGTTAKDPGQWDEVTSLVGITSLPVFKQVESVYSLVRVSLSVLKGVDGREISLQVNEDKTFIQWRYTDGMWQNLISVADLKGKDGKTPVFKAGATGIEWKYDSEPDTDYRVLVDYSLLSLKFEDLTPEQISQIKLKFSDLTEADKAELMKPALDAAKTVEDIVIEANTAIENANNAAANVQDGKTPVMQSVNAVSGSAPAGRWERNGTDAAGNPRYILNITLPQGEKGNPGLPPVFEAGTVTTVDPSWSASVDIRENGETPEGNQKYLIDFYIPRGVPGLPGTGSGNVFVDALGLYPTRKYLFVPDVENSTVGKFVEYSAPTIPEQVQPDWNATEGKGAILNKPGNATAEADGFMTSAEFTKLEKLNPSSLSNDVTGKKVEYTDDGKLLFEGKETFAVDANNELTLAGKTLSELGGGDANVINIPPDIMRLSSDSTSDAIFEIWGGQQLLLEIVKNFNKSTVYTINTIENGYMMLLYPIVEIQYEDDFNYMISVHIQIQENAIDITTEVLEGIASANVLIVGNVINTSVGNTTADRIYLSYGGDNGLDHSDLVWNNNERYDDETGEGSRHLAYGGSKSIMLTNQGDGTKALMDDGTYKEVGGDYQLPAATDTALGGIKTGYAASGNNYPVQLDGSDKAYVNVPWTDTDTTYSPATETTNGLMSSDDKTKLDRIGSYTTATTVANLNANYENIEISNLSANASLSVNLVGTTYNGWDINVFIYCSSARTITIPTSGNYISMIGSSLSCPAGKWTELNLHCSGGKWRIAKLEQQ